MVVVRNTALKWLRRYKLLFVFGTTIVVLQVLLTIRFSILNRNTKEQDWQPIFNSAERMKTESLDANKNKAKLVDLDFALPCEIHGREAISAINRSKTKKCKELIANITCLSAEGKLYPNDLPNYCVDTQNSFVKPLGCFQDNKYARLLTGFNGTFRTENSPQYCAQVCLQSGFVYAAVEYSTQCFCGFEEPAINKKLPNHSCDMICPGDPKQTCGGYDSLNLFHTGIKRFIPQVPSTDYTEKHVRIAFLLTLNGRALRQIKRMIKVIYHTSHFYYIHVDVRQDYLFRKLLFLERHFPNIKLTRKRFATIWGGASLLKMLRSCMNELLHLNWSWDFVLNLSESDYPVKTIEQLTEFLSANRNKNFVKSHGREVQKFIQKQGLDKTFVECETHMYRVADRKLPWGIQIDGGSDWVALNRQFVHYVAGDHVDELVTGLLTLFHYTLLPAESFFHTALRNSKFCNSYIDNNLHVTNWKRKLGCKCQYKHVVDWCGCSPNDFRPEDWPRIVGTETRHIYFARKFEAIISQSVIQQLELWLFDKSRFKADEAARSYWQNVYHYQDLGVEAEESLMSIARASIKRLSKSFSDMLCIIKVKRIIEISTYHRDDAFKSLLIKFKTSQGIFELSINLRDVLTVVTESPLVKRLEHLSVNSDYDQKEQLSRNFAGILSPYMELYIIYRFSFTKATHISFLLVDPTGTSVEMYEVKLDENNSIGHVKINLNQPHLPGVWRLNLIHKNVVLVERKFLIVPLEFTDNSSLNVSSKSLDKNFALSNRVDSKTMKRLSLENMKRKGPKITEWIDDLFSQFYNVENVCGYEDPNICNSTISSCVKSGWSSYFPDPKSAMNQLNGTAGSFDLWL